MNLPSDTSPYVDTLVMLGKQAEQEEHTDTIKNIVDKVLNHHTGSTLMGAGLGSAVGALTGKEGERKKRALIGGAIGGSAGLNLSHLFPEASGALNFNIANKLIAQPIGRVATNLMYPAYYQGHKDEVISDLLNKPKESLSSIWHDRPMSRMLESDADLITPDGNPVSSYDASGGTWVKNNTPSWLPAREQPYREMFGLKARDFADKYPRDDNGHLVLPEKAYMDLKDKIVTEIGKSKDGPPSTISGLGHKVLGGYALKLNPDKSSYHYKDRWDFDLKPDEHITGSNQWATRLARHLMSKITKPVVFEGDIPIPQPQSISNQ
jgi:hypothetical protein